MPSVSDGKSWSVIVWRSVSGGSRPGALFATRFIHHEICVTNSFIS